MRPHFHLWPVQPQPKEFRYWRRSYVHLIEFRRFEPPEADVLFLRALDRIVDSDPMDQVEFVMITPRVRVSGLDNGEHPSDVNAFNTKTLLRVRAAARPPQVRQALTISSIPGDVTTEL